MSAELHCHSLFSVDGWATPRELVERAAAAGARTFSLTDHNTVDGLEACRASTGELGIDFIPGLELDVIWRGAACHVLAYGFDPTDGRLRALCRRQMAQYAANFDRHAPVLLRRYGVTEAQLRAGMAARYRGYPGQVLSRWFVRDFMVEAGVFANPATADREMNGVSAEAEKGMATPYAWVGLGEVLEAVHGAGGLALLAHPAKGRRGDLSAQRKVIQDALAAGVDGFELYHPTNMAEPHFAELVAEARRLGCPVSGGTDTHADPLGIKSDPDPSDFEVPDWVVETLSGRLSAICH